MKLVGGNNPRSYLTDTDDTAVPPNEDDTLTRSGVERKTQNLPVYFPVLFS